MRPHPARGWRVAPSAAGWCSGSCRTVLDAALGGFAVDEPQPAVLACELGDVGVGPVREPDPGRGRVAVEHDVADAGHGLRNAVAQGAPVTGAVAEGHVDLALLG